MTSFFRRDYASRLKKKIAKYQNAEASRKGGGQESIHVNILYNRIMEELKQLRMWEKYIKYFISDDTSQDNAHAFASMKIVLEQLVQEFRQEMVFFLEDGATQQYKCFL